MSIDTLQEVGVSKKISSFTIPLGATINMDGTAIMQGVAVVFAAQAFHIQLSAADFLTVIATATLASIGTAGVPSVGLITLSMVFNSVGLPVEAIGLIMGIDRILDMTRTAVNITGMRSAPPLWPGRIMQWMWRFSTKWFSAKFTHSAWQRHPGREKYGEKSAGHNAGCIDEFYPCV